MKKFFPIIILIIISALFIFYRFVDIPKYLAFDEIEFTKLALSLDKKPYTPYSSLATGHSTLYFYILLAPLKTFGVNVFALRFPAAIFGIMSVIMFYLVIKELKNYELRIKNHNVLPFLLAIVFLTSRWFLNFARFSFEATFLLFLELTSIYFLLLANAKILNFFATLDLATARRLQRSQKNLISSIYLITSGLFAGLAFISYTPGRIFFILPLTFFVFKLVNSLARRSLDEVGLTRKQFLYFLIPFVIIITPLTNYLINNKDTRINQQFFLMNHEMPINQKLTGLWSNISSISLMFNIKGDMNGRHNYPGKPALNPILATLFIIGLIISIKDFKNLYNKLFLFYFLISLFPALMTYPWENPNMLRTFTVIPAVVYFIGLGLMSFPRRRESILIIITLILLSSFYELRTYFKYQSLVFKESFEIKWPLDKAIKLKNPYEKVP